MIQERPQKKMVDRPTHLVNQPDSSVSWQNGGETEVKKVFEFDKNGPRRTVIPEELPKKGD